MYIHTHRIFFIHSSFDRRLVCFHLSWLPWIMLRWTWTYRYLFETMISSSLGIYLDTGLLDHVVVLFLIFWGAAILFSMMAVPIYILTNSVQGFPFLHVLASTCVFGDNYSNRCGMISHCGFELHSSDDKWYWAFFHIFVDNLYIFFWDLYP